MENVLNIHFGTKVVDFPDAVGSGALGTDEATLGEGFQLKGVFLLGPHGVEEADQLEGLGADSLPVLEDVALPLEEEIGDLPILFEGNVFVQEDGLVPQGMAGRGRELGQQAAVQKKGPLPGFQNLLKGDDGLGEQAGVG